MGVEFVPILPATKRVLDCDGEMGLVGPITMRAATFNKQRSRAVGHEYLRQKMTL
jgi:hypothetical protein